MMAATTMLSRGRRRSRTAMACLLATGSAFAMAQAAAPAPAAAASAPVAATAKPASASTAPATGVRMNLEQAYRMALEHDSVIRASEAGAAAKRERLPQARSQLLPNISADFGRFKNRLDGVTPQFDLQTQSSVPTPFTQKYFSDSKTLTIRQPLYRPFNTADYQQAKAEVRDADATLDKDVQNVAVRVAGAYLEALLAQDQLALVLSQKQAYTTQLDAARKRFQGGAGVRTDIDDAQARLDMAIAQELEARQNLGYTKRQLQVLVDVPIAELAPVDPDKLRRLAPNAGSVQTWTDLAEQYSPELRSLRAQLDAAKLEVDKAEAGHKPTLDAIAQWSVSDSNSVNTVGTHYDQKAIGLQLHVPLYSGGYVNSQVRQALDQQERISETLEATRRDLFLRIEKEYRGITEGAERIRALEQAVRSAETTLVSSRRSFEGGARTLVDVLNAEQQRVSAQRDLANARYEYMASRIRLRALVGQADDQAVRELNDWLKS
jgi:outer membrane protein, protease secretion system